MINSDIIKTRLLIIGSNGLLGQRLVQFFSANNNYELLCASIENKSFVDGVDYRCLDITKKTDVKKIILDFFPDFIINAAAFTNVDKCETEKETAWKINVNGTENIAFYSWTIDAHLIHFSTDYIFDGKNGPYTEDDLPCPINYYGRTKLASENSIKSSGTKFTTIRSNVLYGPAKYGRPDFVNWVVNSLLSKNKINIVSDQYNNPTYIDDIVVAVNKVIDYKKEGIFNIAGEEILSRLDFTYKIAKFFKLDLELINPIKTTDLKQPAARPLNSGLVTLKAQTQLNFKPKAINDTFVLMKKELEL